MPLYQVSYDLEKPGASPADYAKVIEPLQKLGARRVLKSQWFLESTSTPEQILNWIWQFRSSDKDRFLVNQVGAWTSKNLLT